MDEYSGKRAVGGLLVPRKGSGLVLRDAAESGDKKVQFCNRLGCNGRLNHTKSAQNGSEKSSRPLHASSGKEIIGSSTRTCAVVANPRKPFLGSLKKPSSQIEPDLSDTSSVQDEPEVSDVVSSSGRVEIGLQSGLNDAESGKVRYMEAGSSSIASISKPRKVFRQKSGMGNRDTSLGSSVPLASNRTCQGARKNGSVSRYGLGNLRCQSTSDFVPSGCLSSESNISRRKDIAKKGNPKVESSSSNSVRGKKMSKPMSDDSRSSTSTHGISISDSRRARNESPSGKNGIGLGRTRRSMNGNTRTRLSSQGNGNGLLPMVPVVTPQVPHLDIPIAVGVPSSSHQFPVEASSSSSTSFSSASTSGGSSPGIMRAGPAEYGITCSLTNRDGLRRYNMGGIAEVLLALERIEQDEELTHEELLALETNLLLGGLGLYDQHRDMRLDIDNMSYEELLALEEKMGTVSTALPEEALSKCLTRSIYRPISPEEGAMGCSGDENDGKCSICQEEYVIGDEVGKLECEHGYHVACIQQWLRLKNWCPICKGSAATSQSSSFSR